jgi:hypothetical protein
MKINRKHEVIARIAGPGLVLAALLAMVLANSLAGRAQASATSPAAPAAAPAKAAPATRPAVPAKRQPGGTHEGIKVHGHWMIEVKGSDGKLVSHTEFENALVQPGGSASLSALLLGAETLGGYEVVMTSSATANIGPCPLTNSGATACILMGSLLSPEPAGFGLVGSCGGTGFPYQISPAGPCFPLSIGAVTLSSGEYVGLTFSGTAVASASGQITDVYLDPVVCSAGTSSGPGAASDSANNCAQGSGGFIGVGSLTHATLPASGSGAPCGAAGQISCAVNVPAAGDSINVSVTISFQ